MSTNLNRYEFSYLIEDVDTKVSKDYIYITIQESWLDANSHWIEYRKHLLSIIKKNVSENLKVILISHKKKELPNKQLSLFSSRHIAWGSK